MKLIKIVMLAAVAFALFGCPPPPPDGKPARSGADAR